MRKRLLGAIVAFGLLALPVQATDEKTIYLTFDDGPLFGTANILKVLNAEDVPAALFMVGLHAEASAEHKALVEQAKGMELITVGNHSYTHANNHYKRFYSSTQEVVDDLEKATGILGLTAPVHARLPGRDVFRLPKLSRDDFGIGKAEDGRERPDFNAVAAVGYEIYGWDHEWSHESTGKPVQSVEQLLAEIDARFLANREVESGNLILLMHDEMFQDHFDGVSNLTALIDGLKQRGYAFGHIADYDD